MQSHQVIAARFLLKRLSGRTISPPPGKKEIEDDASESSDDSSDDDFERKKPYSASAKPTEQKIYTGGILADEMGLGKSLTAIAVIYSFVHQKKCKCVIVVPSSLVDNWAIELNKWLGVKISFTIAKADPIKKVKTVKEAIETFVLGNSPCLVISYETFRSFAARINDAKNLEVIVCDEGHRLKNKSGNQTIEALSKCKAKKRLILSGTLIQNNLEELFSIVNFACPGFLGSLSSFRSRYSTPIEKGLESGASSFSVKKGNQTSADLKQKLSHIMIRRTQAEVLPTLLPPKTEITLHVGLSTAQTDEYATTAREILKSVGLNYDEAEEYDESDDEAEEDKGGGNLGGLVLPGLQRLRMICNSGSERKVKQEVAVVVPEAKKMPAAIGGFKIPAMRVVVQEVVAPPIPAAAALSGWLERSSKLRFLDEMITKLRITSPTEKVVVVSNFILSLDLVAVLADARGWGFLRIDGGVSVDKVKH